MCLMNDCNFPSEVCMVPCYKHTGLNKLTRVQNLNDIGSGNLATLLAGGRAAMTQYHNPGFV